MHEWTEMLKPIRVTGCQTCPICKEQVRQIVMMNGGTKTVNTLASDEGDILVLEDGRGIERAALRSLPASSFVSYEGHRCEV